MKVKNKNGSSWVAAAAGLVVAVLLTTVAWIAASITTTPGPPASSEQDPSPEAWATYAQELYERWAGTDAEHQAAEVVVAHMLNGAYGDCMASRGFERPWLATVYPAPLSGDPLLHSFWAAGRLNGYFTEKLIRAEVAQRIDHAANVVETSLGEGDAEVACREAHPAPNDNDVMGVRSPALSRELLGQWSEVLAPVFLKGGPLDTYEACIAGSGALDIMGVESTEAARKTLSAPLPIGSVPLSEEEPTEQWTQYLSKERAFVAADWDCRQDVRATLGPLVQQSLDTFASQHANEIDAMREHWESTLQRAEALGWSPTTRH